MVDQEGLMNASKRRKIEETVVQILKNSDLETTTELGVRSAAAGRLGFELSGITERIIVRKLVESFLLSTATEILNSHQNKSDNCAKKISDGITRHEEKTQHKSSVGGGQNYNGKVVCKLSDKRWVTIYDMNGTPAVSIRDFDVMDGNALPRRGISLTTKQWSSFKNNFPSIEDAISKMKSRIRSEAAAKQSRAETKNSVTDKNSMQEAISNSTSIVDSSIQKEQTDANILTDENRELITTSDPQEHINNERIQTEADIPSSSSLLPTALHHKHLTPIQCVRFDGRNYLSWKHHMEFFLKQSNLAYVLVEPCPDIDSNPEISKFKLEAAVIRWNNDDYLCRHNILNSLCDILFQWYSNKIYSARELWEDLKLVYDDDFGTKRSLINKYIHFQIVDGVSIIQQVKELQKIADSITASGSLIDEDFHVSVIVSKLPNSWKEFRAELMHEEDLPLIVLMRRLQVEEESRNGYNKGSSTFRRRFHTIKPMCDNRFGMRKNENKRVCYSCGKEGHIFKYCPDKKFESSVQKTNNKGKGVLSLSTEDTDMVEATNDK